MSAKKYIPRGLTAKQKIFCSEYIKDWNATRAYKKAYPGSTEMTARVEGHKILTKPNILEYYKNRLNNLEEEAQISKLMNLLIARDIMIDKTSTKAEKLKAMQIINEMQGYNEPDKLSIINPDLKFTLNFGNNLEKD